MKKHLNLQYLRKKHFFPIILISFIIFAFIPIFINFESEIPSIYLNILRLNLEKLNVVIGIASDNSRTPQFIREVIAALYKEENGTGTPQFIREVITALYKEENGTGTPQFIREVITALYKEENGTGTPQFIREVITALYKEENGTGTPQFIRDLLSI